MIHQRLMHRVFSISSDTVKRIGYFREIGKRGRKMFYTLISQAANLLIWPIRQIAYISWVLSYPRGSGAPLAAPDMDILTLINQHSFLFLLVLLALRSCGAII